MRLSRDVAFLISFALTAMVGCRSTLLGQGLSAVNPAAQVRDADAVRACELTVDGCSLWGSAIVGGAIRLQLFIDTELTLKVEHRWETQGGFAIAGRLEGDTDGTFSLAVEQQQVSATFVVGSRYFGLVPTGRSDVHGRGVCIARELKAGAAVRCAMSPQTIAVSRTDRTGLRAIGREDLFIQTPTAMAAGGGGGPSPFGACDCGDDQSIVDLLAVYTPASLAGSGGLAALTARLQDGIAEANLAFVNSGITAGGPVNRLTIRLAGVQPIAYDEVSPQWLDHLERVTNPTDGFMDGAHNQRNTFNADVVALIVEDARFTGGAAYYATYSDASAFAVLNWRALGGGTYTFAHELGHTFGCAHDRGNSSFAPFRYAWGYSFAGNNTTYGTIMSYTGVNLVPRFSNPTQIDAPTGQALGTPLAHPLATHNALTIATTHWTIASYRDAPGIKDCNGNGVDDATDIANGTAQDLNGNCRPDECEQRLYVDAGNTGTVDGLSWNTAWTSLADALAFASMKCSNVSEIWVADGTYKPDAGGPSDGAGNRYASFTMRSGLAVIGGFQGKSRPGGGETAINQRVIAAGGVASFPSILSGDINTIGVDTDNSYNVVTAYGTGANAVLDGFTIERGYQDFDGGGMFAQDSAVTVRNCVFRNNRGGGGAAFTAYGGAPTLTNCSFYNNSTPGSGGAVASRGGAHVTLDGCNVHDCNATYGGAVAASFDSDLTVRNSVLENNTATSNSGAIDCYTRCTLAVENTTIRNNHGLSSGAGGAIVHTDCDASFANCTFSGNTCQGTGGAVWIENSRVTFTGCTIENNTAGDNDGGGGISAYTNSSLIVDTTTVRGNTAAWGGGIYGDGSSVVVRRSTIETNHAAQVDGIGDGGGVYIYNCAASTMVSTVVRANTAVRDGGGITLGFGNPLTLSNCTVVGNSSGSLGGGVGMYDSTLNVSNSILFGNTAPNAFTPQDAQLTVFSGARTVDRSCVQGLSSQLGGSGNIGGQPEFTDPVGGDLTLTAASPCIDAGSNALVVYSAVTLDRAGNPRLIDAPSVPDTGVGTAPVVDMGAYEYIPSPTACPADLGEQGGGPGHDGLLDNNDFIAFINYFFELDPHADLGVQGGEIGQDGLFDNNDFIAFITLFFQGCQ